MEFTVILGARYLWVDALCLVQDAPDFGEELLAMDRIYCDATWYLVAAAAEDADSPLPRIGHNDYNQKRRQRIATIRGKTLAGAPSDIGNYLSLSRWNPRAWSV